MGQTRSGAAGAVLYRHVLLGWDRVDVAAGEERIVSSKAAGETLRLVRLVIPSPVREHVEREEISLSIGVGKDERELRGAAIGMTLEAGDVLVAHVANRSDKPIAFGGVAVFEQAGEATGSLFSDARST